MNAQDIVKTLAEKGFTISEQEVQAKIDTFSKTFRLPADEAARAALNHFISTNKLPVQARNKAPAPVPIVQNQIRVTEAVPKPAAAIPIPPSRPHEDPNTSDNILKLIKEMSERVPHRIISYTELIKESGLSQKQIEDYVKTLIAEGKCIEPFIGKIYALSRVNKPGVSSKVATENQMKWLL